MESTNNTFYLIKTTAWTELVNTVIKLCTIQGGKKVRPPTNSATENITEQDNNILKQETYWY